MNASSTKRPADRLQQIRLERARRSPAYFIESFVSIKDDAYWIPFTLWPAQREALTLHHLQNWTLDAIGQRLGRSPAAVAGLIKRGLKQLRQQLNADSD